MGFVEIQWGFNRNFMGFIEIYWDLLGFHVFF